MSTIRKIQKCLPFRMFSTRGLKMSFQNRSTNRCVYKEYRRCYTLGLCRYQRQFTDNTSYVEKYDSGILLNYGEYKLNFPFIWLKDNCRCPTCFNSETFQRNVEANQLSSSQVPEKVRFESPVLTVQWSQNHVTSYNISWLIQNSYHLHHKHLVEKIIWDKTTLERHSLPVVSYDQYMNTDDGLKTHLTNLLKFGFSIVSGVEPNHAGTLKVSKRVCHIMETFFGASWQFTTNMEFKDTAYTNIALGAHTDNTYFSSPSGIQVFHVVEHTGDGGQTLLVDGFHAAECLRKKSPESFELLTKAVVPHEYNDNERSMRSLGTVLSLHPTTKDLLSIRYNPYDRAPLYTISTTGVIRTFYDSYKKLGQEIKNPENEFWIKLGEDMVLFVDNWRVLHGRAAFTGGRHVSGCYLPYDDWTARARHFGLMNL